MAEGDRVEELGALTDRELLVQLHTTMGYVSRDLKDMKDSVTDLKTNQHQEIEKINIEITKLRLWRSYLTGAYVVGAGVFIYCAVWLRDWITYHFHG